MLVTHKGSGLLLTWFALTAGLLAGTTAAYEADSPAEAEVEVPEDAYLHPDELREREQTDKPASLVPIPGVEVPEDTRDRLAALDPTPAAWEQRLNGVLFYWVAAVANGIIAFAFGTANVVAGLWYPVHEFVPKVVVGWGVRLLGFAGLGVYALYQFAVLSEVTTT